MAEKLSRAEISRRYRLRHPEKCKLSRQNYLKSEKGKSTVLASVIRRKANGKLRNTQLKFLYGLTLLEYNEKLKSQNGLCAICNNPPKENKSLSLDHNHITKLNRGLLCDDCNLGLGKFKDSLLILNNAIKYLGAYE